MSAEVRPLDRAALLAERDFLLTSIEDLELEYRAGDLDEADYAALRAGYVARTAETLRRLEGLEEDVAPGSLGGRARPGRRLRRFLGRRRTRRALVTSALVSGLLALALTAASLAGVRLPGQSSSGTVSLPPAQRVAQYLSEARLLGARSEGEAPASALQDLQAAFALYEAVLTSEPSNAEALTYRAWLLRLIALESPVAGEVRGADSAIAAAAAAAPGYAPARAFAGLALLEDAHDGAGALPEFRAFLADHPSATLRASFTAQFVAAYRAAHLAEPAALRS